MFKDKLVGLKSVVGIKSERTIVATKDQSLRKFLLEIAQKSHILYYRTWLLYYFQIGSYLLLSSAGVVVTGASSAGTAGC